MNTLVSKENLEQFSGLLNKEMNEKLIDSIHIKNAFKESDTDLTFDNWIGKLLNRNLNHLEYVLMRPVIRNVNPNGWHLINFTYLDGNENMLTNNNRFTATEDGLYWAHVNGIGNPQAQNRIAMFTLNGPNMTGSVNNPRMAQAHNNNTSAPMSSLSCILPLNKGDFLNYNIHTPTATAGTGNIGINNAFGIFINLTSIVPDISELKEKVSDLERRIELLENL